jgi:hypothetical protein
MMSIRSHRALLAFGAVMLLSMPAQSAILYQQPTLNADADLGAFQDVRQELADDFSLAAPGILSAINWKGGYYLGDNVNGSERFTIHLHTDNGGVPSVPPFYSFFGTASVTPTSDARLGETIYSFFLDVTDVTLNSGVLYWLSIFTIDNPLNYAWSPSAEGSTDGALRGGGGPWREDDDMVRSNHVFVLNSANAASVIEPSTLSILGLAVVGLGLTRWRKRVR